MFRFRYGKFSKVIIHIIIIFFAFFIQTSVFPLIPYFSCSPNFLLIITFSYGLLYGEDIGIITGLFCGFLCDMYFNGDFGLYILIFSVIGFGNGILKESFYENSITLPMILSIVNGLIYNLYIYLTHFLIRKKFNLIYYFTNIIIPSILFTLIATVLIYKLFYKATAISKRYK